MKKNLTWIGFLIVLAFTLSMLVGCAEKKAVVKEGATQEVTSDQAAKDAAAKAEADRLAREAAERAKAGKDQEAKVEAAATVDVLKDIFFDFDKSNIRPDARETLKANADYILKNKVAGVVIEGNCDERGTAEYNMALGQKRAQEAKKYLVNLGVKGSAVKTVSYGKERPVDQGHDEEAWAKNRRDHFVIKNK